MKTPVGRATGQPQHGWLRVRGGPWCSENMSAPPPGLQSRAPAAREGASSAVHPTTPAPLLSTVLCNEQTV